MMNERRIFVDTAAWFAVTDRSDHNHKKAMAHLKKLHSERIELVTSNLVVHESFMLLSRKTTRTAAITFVDKVYTGATVLQSDKDVESEAYELIRNYSDQDFSVVDCVSFILMQREHLRRAFTFDKHFQIMNFDVEPISKFNR